MAYNVTGLTAYVEEHNLPLLAKSISGAKSSKLFTLMNVNGDSALNLIDVEPTIQAGGCGWNASGDTKLSQRVLKPAVLKVNSSWCDKDLAKTWANYQVRYAAGRAELPFEETIMNQLADGVADKVEKMIYFGESGQTNQFEGLISILTNASVETVAKSAGTSAFDAIKDVYMALPEAVATKEDTVILVSEGIYRQYVQELVAKNLFNYATAENDANGETKIPGTSCRVIAVSGLNGGKDSKDYIVAGRLSNIFYGTQFEGDETVLDSWYSKDNQEFRTAIGFIAGVQVAYPDEIVMGTIAQ